MSKVRSKPIWGIKNFLSGIDLGMTVVCPSEYKRQSLRSIGCVMTRDFGVKFSFRSKDGMYYVTRVE